MVWAGLVQWSADDLSQTVFIGADLVVADNLNRHGVNSPRARLAPALYVDVAIDYTLQPRYSNLHVLQVTFGGLSAVRRKPVYHRISQDYLSEIRSGRLRRNDFLPSENQLSTRYAISRPSVRLALNELVTLGMVERIPGKGTRVTYRPPSAEQTIKLLLADTHGRPVDPTTSPFAHRVLQVAIRTSHELGFLPREEYLPIQAISKNRCNGAILISPGEDEGFVEALERTGALFVSVVRVRNDRINCLTTGNYAGPYAVADYFARLGRSRMLYLHHLSPHTNSHAALALQARLRGVRDAMADNGVAFPDDFVFNDINNTAGACYEATRRVIDNGRGIDVVFAAGGDGAGPAGVLRALEERGLRVPEDVAIVGLEIGSPFTLHLQGVSVLDMRVEDLAREAVQTISGLLEGTLRSPVRKNLGYRFDPGPGLPGVAEVLGCARAQVCAIW